MSLLKIINVKLQRADGEEIGVVVSPVYQLWDASLSIFAWAVDVDLQISDSNPNVAQQQTIVGALINDPSRGVFSADIGTQVALKRRIADQRYTVTGLAKFSPGTTSVCLVTITAGVPVIGAPVVFGTEIRYLTYEELFSLGGTYGTIPYGTAGKFDQGGSLISFIFP
jgi:hypothetical protein